MVLRCNSEANADFKLHLAIKLATALLKIADTLEREALLGNDSLALFGVRLDITGERVYFEDDTWITGNVFNRQQSPSSQHISISMVTSARIPPRSVMPVQVRINTMDLPSSHSMYSIATPLHLALRNGVFLMDGLISINDNKSATVHLVNPSQVHARIFKNTTVGSVYCEDIDEVHLVDDRQKLKIDSIVPKPQDYADLYKQIDSMDLTTDTSLTVTQQQTVRTLLRRNIDVFAINPKRPAKNLKVRHSIPTGDHPPIRHRPFRVSPAEEEVIRKEVKEMLSNDIIKKSTSPWAAPVVLVKKKDGSIRFCVDYRKLNTITKKNVYPLPRIDDTLDRLAGMEFYSSIDLASGYWHIEIADNDKEKTAFVCCAGLFQFEVMPFGLTSAPATFQSMMDEVLDGIDMQVCRDYLDDILAGSKNFQQHITDLQEIFDRLRSYRLCMKFSKCHFFRKRLAYLGHIISKDGVAPDPAKLDTVDKMLPPSDINGLRRFLGLTSYYRRFVKDYAHVAEPLTRLLRKNNLHGWNDDCQLAFEELKRRLVTAPILSYPDFTQPFILHTDASNFGLGTILSQKKTDGEHVVAYASRTLSQPERNYSATERECLAIIWAITHFRSYLFGRKFTAVTDHSALKWLMESKTQSGRLARWALRLQEFDMEIIHRPGRTHANADALSRIEDNRIMVIDSADTKSTFDAELKTLQRADNTLLPLIEYLENDVLPQEEKHTQEILLESAGFTLKDGILYRVVPTARMLKNGRPEHRAVIPSSLKHDILMANHNDLLTGHLGIKRTYDRICAKYYWKSMYRDVQEHCNTCVDCIMRKGHPSNQFGESYSIPARRAFEIIGADICGPLRKTESGNRYILVFTDHFTKWVEAFAIPRQDAQTVAEYFVREIVARHGAPEKILTDRGKAFIGEFMTEVTNKLSVTQLKTTAYHPQTNGLTERFNKTLADMLSMFVSSHQKDWDQFLPFVLFAYRTSVHSTTGETPFFLMHGRDARLPVDLVLESNDTDGFTSIQDYKKQLVETLTRVQQEVQQITNVLQQQRERKANLNRPSHPFQVASLVWLYCKPRSRKGLTAKLMQPWQGPYRIVSFPHEMTAQLQTLTGRVLPAPAHVSRLKLYETPTRPAVDLDLDDDIDTEIISELTNDTVNKKTPRVTTDGTRMEEDSDSDGDDIRYEVERVMGHRKRNGKFEFRVKWKGYEETESTWEPREHLDNCLPKLDEYFRAIGLKCSACDFIADTRRGLRTHTTKTHHNDNVQN